MENELRKYIRSIIIEGDSSIQERFLGFGRQGEKKEVPWKGTPDKIGRAPENAPPGFYESGRNKKTKSEIGKTNQLPENTGEDTTIEQEIKNIVQDVAERKTSVDDAVFAILHIAEFVSNYTHRATMEPHMSEVAVEIDEERITNDEGKEFAKRKENFIGSHCWGEKLGDGSYVVMSYGKQFPLYIFWNKKNKWYENSDHYLYNGEPQESTEEHRGDLRPMDETRKKQVDWMRKLSNHLLKVNGMSDYEHISVEPGTKN